MKLARTRFAAYAAGVALLAGAGGYYGGKSAHEPPLVEISRTACGLPPTTTRLKVPLETALAAAGNLRIGIGPIALVRGGGTIDVRFDPELDGSAPEVRMIDDVLHLPAVFGREKRSPARITIGCRDGVVATVRYQGDRRGSMSFNVVRERAAASAPTRAGEGDASAEPGTPSRGID